MSRSKARITLNGNIKRQKGLKLTSFDGIGIAQILDALGLKTAVDYRIKPLVGQTCHKRGLLGPALTVLTSPGDNLGVYAAIHYAQPDDVLVISTTDYHKTGLMGDLMLKMARNRGIKGIVTDGLIRDSAGMRDVPVPIYCKGVSANAPSRTGPAKVGFPITIGGVTVFTGDLVFVDEDGVAIVPQAGAEELEARLNELIETENALEKMLSNGSVLWDDIVTLIEEETIVSTGL